MHLQFTKWILSDSCFWAKKSNFPCLCPCTQSAQPGINIFETKIQSKGFIRWLLRNLWYLFNHAFNGKREKNKVIIFLKKVLLQNSLFYAINNCLILSFASCIVAVWHPCQFTVKLCLRWWAPLFALVQLQFTANGSWQHSFNRKLLMNFSFCLIMVCGKIHSLCVEWIMLNNVESYRIYFTIQLLLLSRFMLW